MEEQTKPTETDFQDAFVAEMSENADPVTPPVETPKPDDKPADPVTPPVDPEKPIEKTDEEKAADEAKLVEGEKPEETEARQAKEAEDVKAADDAKLEAEKAREFATKDDVKDAMREYQKEVATESAAHIDKIQNARDQVIEKLHPEGIDQKIYDTNGNIIKTAQDIVDRALINPNTNEAYSYDEAASFMLEAGKKMAENVKELEDWAEGIAEKNIDLLEGNERVLAKWGDVFKALPKETVEKLATDYVSTQLKFDKTQSYVTEMNMTPEAFYATVMAPYTQLNQSLAAKTEADAKAATEAAKAKEAADLAEQNERNGGIPPQRGQSATKSNTGDAMLDALVDEMAKG